MSDLKKVKDDIKMKNEFIEVYKKYIKRDGSSELLSWLEESDFFSAPASTKFHGAYNGGLVEHSVNVFNETIRLLRAYPEIKVSGETVAICTLLHDICKCNCYKESIRNVKDESGKWIQVPCYEYKEEFNFGGHGSKSVFLIQKFMKLTDEEAVAINCHMGFADRTPNDYTIGAAYENNLFAWLIHVADESATYVLENRKN